MSILLSFSQMTHYLIQEKTKIVHPHFIGEDVMHVLVPTFDITDIS